MKTAVISRREGRVLRTGILLALVLAAGAGGAEPAAKDARHPQHTNRLARETSPYLLMHAHNPVDWYPWGPEAFARARKEKKLVFLSIGYSTCYWCHVMERKCFENAEVARLLNRDFVCIKVDREERPDIDSTYMTALQVMGQNGGWPLSMFLTPEGKPIIGFTYRPPDDQEIEGQKVLGFMSILKLVAKAWTDKRKELTAQADKVAELTTRALARRVPGRALVDLDRPLVTAAVEALQDTFDERYGGFGSPDHGFKGAKFPTPPILGLLLYEAAHQKSGGAQKMLTATLDHMARGGIYDQLGGGFHRYSTERTWTVPHFEKMLYDNAQLAEVYAGAYRLTKSPLYRRVLRETLDFVAREMTSPEGGFYSALDAETQGEEGRFYVWTDAEIAAALPNPKEAELVKKVYGAADGYNFEKKYHVLTLPRPLAEIAGELKLTEEQLRQRLAPLRQKLFAARAKRPRPFLDKKILTGWNGQMIAGYAVAGKVLNEPKYVQTAARAADFVLRKLRTSQGRLLRSYAAQPGKAPVARLDGYLDDYAYLVHGLLCLHDATGEKKWLAAARELTDTMAELFADRSRTGFFPRVQERGGFFYTANDQEKLFARSKDQFDGAQPSGNSVAVSNLVRLWVKTGEDRYRALAEKQLRAFAGTLKANPGSMTAMVEGLDRFLDAQKGRK